MRIQVIALVVVAAFATSSCSSSEVAAATALGAGCLVGGVIVSPASATLYVGDTLHALAALETCSSQPPSGLASWTSSDTSVAVVGALTGLVHARSAGRATIIATSPLSASVQGAMVLNVSP